MAIVRWIEKYLILVYLLNSEITIDSKMAPSIELASLFYNDNKFTKWIKLM